MFLMSISAHCVIARAMLAACVSTLATAQDAGQLVLPSTPDPAGGPASSQEVRALSDALRDTITTPYSTYRLGVLEVQADGNLNVYEIPWQVQVTSDGLGGEGKPNHESTSSAGDGQLLSGLANYLRMLNGTALTPRAASGPKPLILGLRDPRTGVVPGNSPGWGDAEERIRLLEARIAALERQVADQAAYIGALENALSACEGKQAR